MKRGTTGLSALIAVDKPEGMTSHDVVNRVRRITGEGRVGHAGTLDPAATGVMVVGIGPATRLLPYLTGHDKSYVAHIVFGAATNADDAEGEVICTAPVPEELEDPFFAIGFVDGLVGKLSQVPPAYSAIKRDGVRAYAAARKGEDVELEPREVEIKEAQLLSANADLDGLSGTSWDLVLTVSKGTYIRSLARDMGEALGTCAHLGALRRTMSGGITLADALTLDDLEGRWEEAKGQADCAVSTAAMPDSTGASGEMWSLTEQLCIDPAKALGFEQVEVGEGDILPLYQGRELEAPAGTQPGLKCLVAQGKLLSVHECRGAKLVARTVIPGGVIGVNR